MLAVRFQAIFQIVRRGKETSKEGKEQTVDGVVKGVARVLGPGGVGAVVGGHAVVLVGGICRVGGRAVVGDLCPPPPLGVGFGWAVLTLLLSGAHELPVG